MWGTPDGNDDASHLRGLLPFLTIPMSFYVCKLTQNTASPQYPWTAPVSQLRGVSEAEKPQKSTGVKRLRLCQYVY